MIFISFVRVYIYPGLRIRIRILTELLDPDPAENTWDSITRFLALGLFH